MRLSSSFGGGMGRLREVCGALSGAFMVAGLKYGYSSPDNKEEKSGHYKLIQEIAEAEDFQKTVFHAARLDQMLMVSDDQIGSERTNLLCDERAVGIDRFDVLSAVVNDGNDIVCLLPC